MMKILEDKVAIVTGASSGIGRATASLFAEQGAAVIVAARRAAELEKLVAEIEASGGRAKAVVGDVTSESFNETLVEQALENFGALDIAFNNAGILGKPGPVTAMALEDWQAVINTNLTSCFLAAKYQIPVMVENGGSIIFTSSFVGVTAGFPYQSAYAASKAAIAGLVYCLASEYGADGVRVNAILPGGTDTAMAKEFGSEPEVVEFVRNLHALKRIARPDEIAQFVLHLASDAASFITGSAIPVDGGVSINRA